MEKKKKKKTEEVDRQLMTQNLHERSSREEASEVSRSAYPSYPLEVRRASDRDADVGCEKIIHRLEIVS